jgi:hypothetical protein
MGKYVDLVEKTLTEKKNKPTRELFGLSFSDYDAYMNNEKEFRKASYDDIYPEKEARKWQDEVGKKIAKLQKNKRQWKKFEDAFKRGDWQDYYFSVTVDDEGNWVSTKKKKSPEEMKKQKAFYKKIGWR